MFVFQTSSLQHCAGAPFSLQRKLGSFGFPPPSRQKVVAVSGHIKIHELSATADEYSQVFLERGIRAAAPL